MSTRVLKNSSGNVLKNSSGKVMKANYNYGNAIKYPSADTSKFIRLLRPTISGGDFSTVGFFRSASYVAQFRLTNSNGDILSIDVSNGNGFVRFNLDKSYSALTNSKDKLVIVRYSSASGKFHLSCGRTGFENPLVCTSFFNYAVTAFDVFLCGTGRSTEVIEESRAAGDFYLYDRGITSEEINYFYNNGLGNSELNRSGLIYQSRLEKAEILDFSANQDGSDLRVGLRDESENLNHGEQTGLPAGTLQEQVDYANNNLFMIF